MRLEPTLSTEDLSQTWRILGMLSKLKKDQRTGVEWRVSYVFFSVTFVKIHHNWRFFFFFFFCHIADAANERSEREVFDLPSSVNYNQEYTIETLVVADKKMTDFHGVEELKTYVPTLINIVRKKNPHDLRCRYRSIRTNSARKRANSRVVNLVPMVLPLRKYFRGRKRSLGKRLACPLSFLMLRSWGLHVWTIQKNHFGLDCTVYIF